MSNRWKHIQDSNKVTVARQNNRREQDSTEIVYLAKQLWQRHQQDNRCFGSRESLRETKKTR